MHHCHSKPIVLTKVCFDLIHCIMCIGGRCFFIVFWYNNCLSGSIDRLTVTIKWMPRMGQVPDTRSGLCYENTHNPKPERVGVDQQGVWWRHWRWWASKRGWVLTGNTTLAEMTVWRGWGWGESSLFPLQQSTQKTKVPKYAELSPKQQTNRQFPLGQHGSDIVYLETVSDPMA